MEKILSFLSKEQSELDFFPLEARDVKRLKESAKFDLDYLCMIETGNVIFSNDATNIVFGQNYCNVYKRCVSVKIRSQNCYKGFIIGDLGSFKVAVVTDSVIDDEEIEEHIDNDTEEYQRNEKSKWNRQSLDTLLQSNMKENCAFKDIQVFILNHFSDTKISIFRYGQKMDMRIANDLLKSFSNVALVEIALAVECEATGFYISPSLNGQKLSNSYATMFSSNAANLIYRCNDSKTLLPNSHRFIAYNSSYHTKVNVPYKLKSKGHKHTEGDGEDEVS